MSRHQETIAALATPAGTAAIALLRVSGDDAGRIMQDIFGATPLPRVARHGDYRDLKGLLLDDVVFTFFQGPRSYTGEDSLEISSHGNPFIAQKILEDLFARGCRAAMPGEFTQRAFLNGRMDLSQAESVMDLIQARSERALTAANQQLRGALGRRIEELSGGLLDVLARVEAYIDFPDEDLPPEDRTLIVAKLREILRESEQLLATSHYGEILRDGLKTVILGEPNAGKSSLLNRLVGRERALVSPEAGTTRDFIEERIMLGPHCLRLIDTAGLNSAPGPIEKLGIEKTLERAAEADLILLVLDATQPKPNFSTTLPVSLNERIKSGPTLIVWNKSDLGSPRLLLENTGDEGERLNELRVSSLTGDGIGELTSRIINVSDSFQVSVGNDLIAISARHADALGRVKNTLFGLLADIDHWPASELLASDLRGVLAALGEITGRIDNEKMLDRLFSAFCIGK